MRPGDLRREDDRPAARARRELVQRAHDTNQRPAGEADHENDGFRRPGNGDGVLGIRDIADDREARFRFQQLPQSFAQHQVLRDEQDCNRRRVVDVSGRACDSHGSILRRSRARDVLCSAVTSI